MNIEHLPKDAVLFVDKTICGIYFLCQEGEIVYVGRTYNLVHRLLEHRQTKQYDAIYYVQLPVALLVSEETRYIHALKPRLNARAQRKPASSVRITFSLDDATLKKLDKIAKRVTPKGSEPNNSAAIRNLIEKEKL